MRPEFILVFALGVAACGPDPTGGWEGSYRGSATWALRPCGSPGAAPLVVEEPLALDVVGLGGTSGALCLNGCEATSLGLEVRGSVADIEGTRVYVVVNGSSAYLEGARGWLLRDGSRVTGSIDGELVDEGACSTARVELDASR